MAAGFTNSAGLNGDKLATLQQLALFAMQHSMIWVGLGLLPGNHTAAGSPDDLNRLAGFLGAMAQSNADQGPELVPPWPIVEPPSTWAAESPRRPNAGTTAALPPKRSHERRANPPIDRDGARRATLRLYFDGLLPATPNGSPGRSTARRSTPRRRGASSCA